MGDGPNIPRNVMPVCSWHFASFLKELFVRQKQHTKAMKRAIYSSLLVYFNQLAWSDLDYPTTLRLNAGFRPILGET